MSHKNLLIIFTRNPVLGKVKTRLAKTVGDKTALDIYHFLLQKTSEISKKISCDKKVYYSEKIIIPRDISQKGLSTDILGFLYSWILVALWRIWLIGGYTILLPW